MMFFKKITLFIFFFNLAFIIFSQNNDEDDFDLLFETDVEDVYLEQTKTSENVVSVSAPPSIFNFSGNLDAVLSGGIFYQDKIHPAGYLEFSNDLILTVRPNSFLNINGCLNVSLEKSFNLSLSYLYFDYLMFNRIYLSAGKKAQTMGGYTRIITENSITDTSGNINLDLKIPWSTGTFFAFMSWNINGLNMNNVYSEMKNFTERVTYAIEFEQTIHKTSLNLFAKYYSQAEKINGIRKSPVLGVEAKRTIVGIDSYLQCIVEVKNYKRLFYKDGYGRFSGIVGFYRLWDQMEHDVGLNVEYQVVWNQYSDREFEHIIALQAGINHLGKNKNSKIVFEGKHNFVCFGGTSKIALLTSGIIPYADWVNAIEIEYQRSIKFIPKIMTGISIDLNY